MYHGKHKWIQQNVGENKTVKYHWDVLKLQKTDSQMYLLTAWGFLALHGHLKMIPSKHTQTSISHCRPFASIFYKPAYCLIRWERLKWRIKKDTKETYTALCALSWQDIKQLSLITQTLKVVKFWMTDEYHVNSYSYFYCGNISNNLMIHIQRNTHVTIKLLNK